ncbi:MAG: MotA/TolQ/ExbB proton channel family protein [Deltaproteobacteria bacterium]|nr:MotA/TolQ/ExbB proton channel family protein [Deltaproteobacteria bacterium]
MFEFIGTAFEKGGPVMYFILLCFIFMLGVAIERIIVLYFQSNVDKETFIKLLQKHILNGDLQKALKITSISRFPLAKILHAGLLNAQDNPDDVVQAAMDESALQELPKVEQRTGYLAMLGNVAVLVGLLGTIVGLIRAFGAVAEADAAEKATELAKGISEAMYCTAFGLSTAILSIFGYAFLQSKTQHIVDDVNEATVTIMNLITQNREKFKDKPSSTRTNDED